MSEASTGETQSTGTSPARQMLAALTRASQEMGKSFNDTCEHVSRLNDALENKINERMAELNEHAEQLVKVQLDGLSADKDAILSELTELRQEELLVLQTVGKSLRDALTDNLKEIIDSLKSKTDERLKAFQESLTQTETEVTQTVDNLRKTLADNMPEHLKSVQEGINTEKKALEELQAKYQERLNQDAGDCLNDMVEHCAALKERLEEEGQSYLESVDSALEGLITEQTEKLKQRVESLKEMQEKAAERTQVDIDVVKNLPESFTESCKGMASIQVDLHGTMVTNLALVYRTDILSAAKITEDQLQILRVHLQSQLRSYQEQFSDQSSKLLSKFEKAVKELQPHTLNQESKPDEELPSEIQTQLDKIKKELAEKSNEKIAAADETMAKLFEEFSARLEKAAQSASKAVEANFSDGQKEIAALAEQSKEKLAELTLKAETLEQLTEDARELISALDQSNLDF